METSDGAIFSAGQMLIHRQSDSANACNVTQAIEKNARYRE
jgi:hypothetical protein